MILAKNKALTGIILAGGKSTRMGEDKGLMAYNNEPFIAHIIKSIASLTNKIIIITNTKAYEQFGYPCIGDTIPNCGPIGGIYTGLNHSTTEYNLILSCDTPFVTPGILENLILKHQHNYQATFYNNTPLIGLYNKSISKVFLKNINEQKLKLQEALLELTTQSLPISSEVSLKLVNINTQKQYKEAIGWN